ncbi:MAG: hypothetical protein QF464_16565 [Myxococcota bacterium]|nr:hypothetical protein [Myxococcota bacterium]
MDQLLDTMLDSYTPARTPSPVTTVAVLGFDHTDSWAVPDRCQYAPDFDPEGFAYDRERAHYLYPAHDIELVLALGESDVHCRARLGPSRAVLSDRLQRYLLQSTVAVGVVQADALLVHGCAMVNRAGEALLFLGASGDGKSTMTTRLPGWTVLADDAVLLEAPSGRRDEVLVSGTLFSGSEQIPRRGDRHPLRHLVVLKPGTPSLSLTPLEPVDGVFALSRRVFWPLFGGPMTQPLMSLIHRIAERVPAKTLASNLTHDVAPLLGTLSKAGC